MPLFQSQLCAITTIVNFKIFSSSPPQNHCLFQLSPSTLSKPQSRFYIYRFAYSGKFIQIKSCNTWCFVMDFFHFTCDSFKVFPCCSMYHSINFYGQIVFHYLYTPHSVDPIMLTLNGQDASVLCGLIEDLEV